MSPPRMNRLPPGARVAADQPGGRGTGRKRKTAAEVRPGIPRAEPGPGAWRCGGPRGCGDVIEGAWGRMEHHLDGHGGGRAEAVFTTTKRGGAGDGGGQ